MSNGKIRLMYRSKITIPSISMFSENFHFMEMLPPRPTFTEYEAKVFKCNRLFYQNGVSMGPVVSEDALELRGYEYALQ